MLLRRGLLPVTLLSGIAWSGRATALQPPSFMVFFKSGHAEITPYGENTIQQFAGIAAKLDWNIDISISAHRFGGGERCLSIARGMAVRDRLIELGVPADRIAVRVNADRQLMVSTGPNTPEPQNRRVELIDTVRQRGR